MKARAVVVVVIPNLEGMGLASLVRVVEGGIGFCVLDLFVFWRRVVMLGEEVSYTYLPTSSLSYLFV